MLVAMMAGSLEKGLFFTVALDISDLMRCLSRVIRARFVAGASSACDVRFPASRELDLAPNISVHCDLCFSYRRAGKLRERHLKAPHLTKEPQRLSPDFR